MLACWLLFSSTILISSAQEEFSKPKMSYRDLPESAFIRPGDPLWRENMVDHFNRTPEAIETDFHNYLRTFQYWMFFYQARGSRMSPLENFCGFNCQQVSPRNILLNIDVPIPLGKLVIYYLNRTKI